MKDGGREGQRDRGQTEGSNRRKEGAIGKGSDACHDFTQGLSNLSTI